MTPKRSLLPALFLRLTVDVWLFPKNLFLICLGDGMTCLSSGVFLLADLKNFLHFIGSQAAVLFLETTSLRRLFRLLSLPFPSTLLFSRISHLLQWFEVFHRQILVPRLQCPALLNVPFFRRFPHAFGSFHDFFFASLPSTKTQTLSLDRPQDNFSPYTHTPFRYYSGVKPPQFRQ